MTATVLVKVLGFSDVERHSINTLFRLSGRKGPNYQLWTPESTSPPQVALLDVDSYEAGLELESPRFNPNVKVIAVGAEPPETAWRCFERPVEWAALLMALDELFSTGVDVDFDLDLCEPDLTIPAPFAPVGVTVCLVVGLTPDQRLYLRARLSLAGLTDMDEAVDAAQAAQRLAQRHYDLMIIGLDLIDADAWSLVEALKDQSTPPRSVVLVSSAPNWSSMERAEQLGCLGILEVPFNPPQVRAILERV